VESTNDTAKALFRAGRVDDVAYVVADRQTAGRGTRGRSWVSPPGVGIYVSIVHVGRNLRQPVTTLFTQSAGVGCVDAIRETTDVPVVLKPVNDLLVAGRKLGGILTETIIRGRRMEALITGIGINIEAAPDVGPGGYPTTCLRSHMSAEFLAAFDPSELIEDVVEHVCRNHARVFAGDMQGIETAWRARLDPALMVSPG